MFGALLFNREIMEGGYKIGTATLRLTSELSSNTESIPFTHQRSYIVTLPPIHVHVCLTCCPGMLVGAPVLLLLDFKGLRRRSLARKNLQGYVDNPVEFMKKRSTSELCKVSDLDNVTKYVTQQMEPVREYLDAMREAVPKLVKRNRKLMEDILNDKRTRQEIEDKNLRYETIIPELQQKLSEFGSSHVREYDFRAEQVEMVTIQDAFFAKRNRMLGIWTEVKHAQLQHNEQRRAVSVKTYREKTRAVQQMMEEKHLG